MNIKNSFKFSLQFALFTGLSLFISDALLAESYRLNFRGINFLFNQQDRNCYVLQNGRYQYAGTIQQCVDYINRNNNVPVNVPANNSRPTTNSNWGNQPSSAQPYYCTTIGQYCSAQQYALEQQYKNNLNNQLNQSVRGFSR
jgi:hypothetical protein